MYLKSDKINCFGFYTTLFTIFLIGLLVSCTSKSSSSPDIRIQELDKYKTFVSLEEEKLVNPTILRYDGDSLLYIYDAEKRQVLGLNGKSNVTRKYGRQGRGPGEFIRVNNIFVNDSYLYVVNQIQSRIARFGLNENINSSLSYGSRSKDLPPPAPKAPFPRAKNWNNQPFVMQNGNILLSEVEPGESFDKLYKMVNWERKIMSYVGDIPEESTFLLDYDEYHFTIDDEEIPAFYKSNVFPVDNVADTSELYFIYSAFPKIVKYDDQGDKLWETNVPETPELSSLVTNFFDISQEMSGRERIALNTYVSGVSSTEGNLYLAMGKNYFSDPSNHLWIHEFNPKGKLIVRYKLISEDVNIPSIFDIDFEGRRIFVPTKEAEISAYSF